MPSSSRYSLGPGLHRGHDVSERVQNNEMGTSVLIMRPILRFLQLLCENHNRDLQVSASLARSRLSAASHQLASQTGLLGLTSSSGWV